MHNFTVDKIDRLEHIGGLLSDNTVYPQNFITVVDGDGNVLDAETSIVSQLMNLKIQKAKLLKEWEELTNE